MAFEPSQSSSAMELNASGAIVLIEPETRKPRLPIELCEHIIDHIFSESGDYPSRYTQKTLSTCSLVCRAWYSRAQTHLFKNLDVDPQHVACLDTVLRRNRHLYAGIARIGFRCNMSSISLLGPSISSFAIGHRLSSLFFLRMDHLDLMLQHTRIYRAPLFRSVKHLTLSNLRTCQISHLVRFINSFPDLDNLGLHFITGDEIAYRGQVLPNPSYTASRSLTEFTLDLVPGVSRLVDWFVKAEVLLVHLKSLILFIRRSEKRSNYQPYIEAVGALFERCSSSVESLHLVIETSNYLVPLSTLQNLKTLCFDYIFEDTEILLRYAVAQLQTITSNSGLHEVILTTLGDLEDKDLCRTLDEILSGVVFSSLRSVHLPFGSQFYLFPKLYSVGLFKEMWMSYNRRNDGPRLPDTLVTSVLNFVFDEWIESRLGSVTGKTLFTCLLVCEDWRENIKENFQQPLKVSYKELAYFGGILRRNKELLSMIRWLAIVQPTRRTCVSSFAIRKILPQLHPLDIERLDLTSEHRWLNRAPLFRSVKTLQLHHLQTCRPSQLIRFLRAFPSLSKLDISLPFGELQHNGKRPFGRSHSDTQRLLSLLPYVDSGVLEMADWCVGRKDPFDLYVRCEEAFEARYERVEKLFDYFHVSPNSLTVYLHNVPILTVNVNWYWTLNITFRYSPRVLDYAAQQLATLPINGSVEISFDINLSAKDHHRYGHLYRGLDEALARDIWSWPKKSVFLHKSISFLLFPRLYKVGALNVLEDSRCEEEPILSRKPSELKVVDWVYDQWLRFNGDKTNGQLLAACLLIHQFLLFSILLINILRLRCTLHEPEFRAGLEGVRKILACCRTSIEDIRLYVDIVPRTQTAFDPAIRLDSFPNLKFLTYGSCWRDSVLLFVVRQLQMVTLASTLMQITLDIRLDKHRYHLDARLCRAFDKLLFEDKFPNLRTVVLHKTIHPMLFPTLSRPPFVVPSPIPSKPGFGVLTGSFWIEQPLERLPLEICLRIVDLIYDQWVKSGWSFEAQTTLFACSLVCKQWKNRALRYLSKPVEVSYEDLFHPHVIRQKYGRKASGILGIKFIRKSETHPISPFVIQHRLPNLTYLGVEDLDLTREHKWLHRSPLFRSVRTLSLCRLQPCGLPQLIRFINSFPYLSRLNLDLDFNKLEDGYQPLPKPSYIGARSLTWLQLDLKSGVAKLINWLLQDEFLLSKLQTLVLQSRSIMYEDEFRSSVMGMERLLKGCRNSVEGLWLRLEKAPFVESISDLVQLHTFPKLKYLVYGSLGSNFVLRYAIRQLKAIPSACKLVVVVFDIRLDGVDMKLDQNLCGTLDEILTGNKLPSLQSVALHKTISFELFPKLNKAERLRAPSWSFWPDPPKRAEGSEREH